MAVGTISPGVVRTDAPQQFDGAVTHNGTVTNNGPVVNAGSVTNNGPVSSTGSQTVGGHMLSTGTAPAAAAGANNGTSPPAPVVAASSTDMRGSLTFGSGSTPAAGAQVAVTFATAYASAPVVVISPGNDATAVLTCSVTGVSTTGFTLTTHTAPTGSQAATVYAFSWAAIG